MFCKCVDFLNVFCSTFFQISGSRKQLKRTSVFLEAAKRNNVLIACIVFGSFLRNSTRKSPTLGWVRSIFVEVEFCIMPFQYGPRWVVQIWFFTWILFH